MPKLSPSRRKLVVVLCNAAAAALLIGAGAFVLWWPDLVVGGIVVIFAVFTVRILVQTVPEWIDPIKPRSSDESRLN